MTVSFADFLHGALGVAGSWLASREELPTRCADGSRLTAAHLWIVREAFDAVDVNREGEEGYGVCSAVWVRSVCSAVWCGGVVWCGVAWCWLWWYCVAWCWLQLHRKCV